MLGFSLSIPSKLRPAGGQLPLPLLVVHGVCRDAAAKKNPFRKRWAGICGHSGHARRSPATRAGLHRPRGHRRHLRLHVNTRRPAGRSGRSAQPRAWTGGRCLFPPGSTGRRAHGPAARHLLLLGLGARGVPHCVSKFKSSGGLLTGSCVGRARAGPPARGSRRTPCSFRIPKSRPQFPHGFPLNLYSLRPSRSPGRTVYC